MGKHSKQATGPLQQELEKLEKLLAGLRRSFQQKQIDQKSYDRMQRSYRDDIARVEQQIRDNK